MTDPVDRSRALSHPRSRGAGVLGQVREAAVVVLAAVVLSLLVKTFLLQAFWIPSESMEDTLRKGDRVVVSELTPGPFALHRGDVVVFADPGGWLLPHPAPRRGPVAAVAVPALTWVGLLPDASHQHLVKRVIGLPGDTVACVAGHRTTVNGVPVREDYLAPGAVPSQVSFTTTVPAGHVWVEGDNRQHSEDSRFHRDRPGGGSVAEDLLVGRAVARVWPLPRVGPLWGHHDVFAGVPEAGRRPPSAPDPGPGRVRRSSQG